MPFLFVLYGSGSEDAGEEVPAYVVNIVMATLYTVVLSITGVAWLKRRRGSTAVAIFYDCTVAGEDFRFVSSHLLILHILFTSCTSEG